MAPASLKRQSTSDQAISPPPAKRKLTTTATSKAVANFFKPASQKKADQITFQTVEDSLIIARYENAHTTSRRKPVRIAAFDFDDTLITTKSGNKFARGAEDWRWWHPSVPGRLKQLHDDGVAVVVVSNQAGISLRGPDGKKTPAAGMKSLSNFKAKVTAVLNALQLPISVYAATEKDLYRKPRTGMWERILRDYELTTTEAVDRGASIFVGDAGGRQGDPAAGTRKDHSCSDRDFAANVEIQFHTPEEYFLGEAAQPFLRTFQPTEYLLDDDDATAAGAAALDAQTASDHVGVYTKTHDLDIVLFCGSPGAGKSTFYWNHMEPLGYARVNQDILKTRDKCMKACESSIIDVKQSVVVDNTNADHETRAAWVALAKKLNVPVRLVLFTASAKLCEHNATVRALSAGMMNPEKRTMLPKLAFSSFASRYHVPEVSEGFDDVTEVNFKFTGTEEEKALWRRYWVS